MLRVAIPDMVSPSDVPATAAMELGFFRKEGLDADIELLFPVTRTCGALREGTIAFVGGAAHAPLYAFGESAAGRCGNSGVFLKMPGALRRLGRRWIR